MHFNLPARRSYRNILFWATLGLLVAAAFVLRLSQIHSLPAGLFYDEAYEGLDAYSLLGRPLGEWPLFFTAINGREPLFVYLVHAAQTIWGSTLLSVRIVSATAGALLTPTLIWLAWELSPWLDATDRRRFALWAGMASLALLWAQTISRLGQRISLFGLLEVLAFAALWRAWGKPLADDAQSSISNFQSPISSPQSPVSSLQSLPWWLLAGFFAGVSFYTYLAVRLLPFVLAPVAVALLVRQRQDLWARRWGILAALGAALVTASPLLIHFAQHPDYFNMRTGQVDILAQGVPALWANVKAVLGMAFVHGDFNLRLNFPDRPVFDLFTVLPFLVGVMVTLRRIGRPAYRFLLSGLGIMLLPTLLSEEAPNFGRSFGAFPFVVLLMALGLDQLATWLSGPRPALHSLWTATGWGLLLAATVLTVRVYFVDWANHPNSFAAWDTGYTALAQAILHSADDMERIYAGPGVAENPTVEYLLADLDRSLYPQRFDGNLCLRVAPDLATYTYVLPQLSPRAVMLLGSYLPQSRSTVAVNDGTGEAWAIRLAQPDNGEITFQEMIGYPVALGEGIEMLGYWLSQEELRAGEPLYVRLFWRSAGSIAQSYTAFVQLLQHTGDDQWLNLAGADRPPGAGSCPTDEWLAGEIVIDELQLTVPATLPDGDLSLAVGFYHPESGQRLSVPGSEGDMILIPLK